MKTKLIVASALFFVIAILLIGCTAPPTTQNSFQLGSEFTAKEGITYTSTTNGLQLSISNFTDSRCPANAQCIWEGERGADVTLFGRGDPGVIFGKVHLGEITARITQTGGNPNYEVELVSIDTDINSAVLIVRLMQAPQISSQEWFSIEPIKCNGNPWNSWWSTEAKHPAEGISAEMPMEIDILKMWLIEKFGINVSDSASKQIAEITCDACTCSTGEKIAVLVDSNFTSKMQELGFTDMGAIACTMEAKLCPGTDVSVGRTAPFCDFEACPDANKNLIQAMSIYKTLSRGFVGGFATKINLNPDYSYSVKGDSNNYSGALTQEQYTALENYILASNFFDLNQKDVKLCGADFQVISLDINIGNKQNTIQGMGEECDKNLLAQARVISNMVDEYTGQPVVVK